MGSDAPAFHRKKMSILNEEYVLSCVFSLKICLKTSVCLVMEWNVALCDG